MADAGFRSESHEALLWAIGTQRSTSLFATQMTHLYCQVKYSPTSFSVPGYYRYWTWICRNLIYQLHLPCSFLLFFILAVRVGGRGVVLSITASFSSPPRNYLNRNPPHNIAQEPILYSPRIGENTKCLKVTLATTSTLLAMCRINARWPTRSPGFWPGYLRLNPRYGTRTFEPAESKRWETGSFKLGHIGTGSVVFVGVNLMVQPCFAAEARGLAKLTLGEREATLGKKGIANTLRW